MNVYLKPYSHCIFEEYAFEPSSTHIFGYPEVLHTYWCTNKNSNINKHSTLKLQKETYLDDDRVVPSICEKCEYYKCKEKFQLLDTNTYYKEEVD